MNVRGLEELKEAARGRDEEVRRFLEEMAEILGWCHITTYEQLRYDF